MNILSILYGRYKACISHGNKLSVTNRSRSVHHIGLLFSTCRPIMTSSSIQSRHIYTHYIGRQSISEHNVFFCRSSAVSWISVYPLQKQKSWRLRTATPLYEQKLYLTIKDKLIILINLHIWNPSPRDHIVSYAANTLQRIKLRKYF